ncbi:MAG: tetratricopeptide repeat protein [Myxococcales bacterium]|nr:tetratricopeptide repeat protein [Myxococcales bacterium]
MIQSDRPAAGRFRPASLLAWLVVVATSAIASIAASPGRAELPTHLGGAACAQCHPKEAREWTGSHHDLAMQPANESTVKGNFNDASHTHQGITTRFFRRGPKFMVHTEGSEGNMADFEVSYTFGVEPLQQYLIGFPDGRFQVLSLAWDDRQRESGGQRWYSIYPDEVIPHGDVLHWTQPSQNWNHMCAECHSTNLRKGYRAETDTFETLWSEIDVSCEACHGPGSIHRARKLKARASAAADVKADRKGESGLTIEFPPVAEANWSIDQNSGMPVRAPIRVERLEVDTCARCHSRRSKIAEGIVPGHPIQDSHRVATLDPPLYYPDGQIRGEVYVYGSFVQSAMFAAGVTCSDCHNPHSGTLRAEGNDLCSRCHPAGRFDVPQHHHHKLNSAGAQCVACHMPSRTYMEIDDRRDHSLRVPRPDLSEPLGSPNACNGCHSSMTSTWAANKINAWYGESRRMEPHWGSAIRAAQTSSVDAEARLVAILANDKVPAIARATAIALLPRFMSPRSLSMFSEAVKDDDPLVRTAAVAALDQFPLDMRSALVSERLVDPVRSVRHEAARVLAPVPASQLDPKTSQRRDAALASYRRAQELDADRADSHMRLGEVALGQGQLDLAQAEYELALTREPSFIPAYVNLADLHRIRGAEKESEEILRAALKIDPNNADVRHALGLSLVRMKRLDEALVELEAAATHRPENPRYPYVYASALHTAGKIDQARRVLRKATAEHPGDRDLQAFLVILESQN